MRMLCEPKRVATSEARAELQGRPEITYSGVGVNDFEQDAGAWIMPQLFAG